MSLQKLRRCCSWLVLGSLLGPMGAQAQLQAQDVNRSAAPARAPSAHEQLLEQIREALSHAMLDQPTQVHSAAWIDAEGRLHENAHFQAQAEVRGIRVQAYLGEAQQPRHDIRFDLVPPALRPSPQADACPAGRDVKLPVKWRVRAEGQVPGELQFAHQTVADLVRQSWQRHMAGMNHWTDLGQHPVRATPAYLQTLTSAVSSHASWGAELVITPITPAAASPWRWNALWSASEERLAWRIEMRWGPQLRADQALSIHWQDSFVLDMPIQRLHAGPSAWTQAMRERIDGQVQRWSQALDERGRCTPQQFAIEATPQAQVLTLQAGLGSGLRNGDRFLIFDRSQLPGRSLETGALQRMGLAEIVRTSEHTSELRLLAGPTPSSRGPWVAVPL